MSVIKQRFDDAKDSAIESYLGKSDTWAKSVRTGRQGIQLDDIPKFLNALGLKVVDQGKTCVDKAVWDAYRTLATAAMADPARLLWEDEDK